jgi:NhaA family Na+:H+ antiporter
VALPVGKLVGITALGWLGQRLVASRAMPGASKPLDIPDLIAVGMLGGIGFTVSLLMNELAFAGNGEVIDEGTLAVLLGSGISIVGAGLIVSLRARHYRHLKPVKK